MKQILPRWGFISRPFFDGGNCMARRFLHVTDSGFALNANMHREKNYLRVREKEKGHPGKDGPEGSGTGSSPAKQIVAVANARRHPTSVVVVRD